MISESCAVNPLLLTGLLLLKLKCKKLFLSNFDGEYDTEKGRSIMRETSEALRFLKSKKLNIQSLNDTYLNVKKVNFWPNDKFFLYQFVKIAKELRIKISKRQDETNLV